MGRSKFLAGKRIAPIPITKGISIVELIENNFQAYNAARLREGAQLFVEKMLADEVTVGLTLTGALTPAGLGISAIIPLIEAGFVDWIVSTGANLYHDTHFGLGFSMHRGNAQINDLLLRAEGVVRIYDIFFDYDVLLSTDAFFREIIDLPEFQREMSTAEFHYLCGKYVAERERVLELKNQSLLAAAYRCGVPIYTSSPGDSSIGMNIAAKELQGSKLKLNPSADVNETAAIVMATKRGGGKSALFICGGGSPKNFALQTEPQIQEVLGVEEKGHDYFLQLTDARPDTGGLCVAEGTLIGLPRDLSQHPDGIPIEALVGQSGFYVYSYDQQQKEITLSEVEKVWCTGEQEVWRLRYGCYTGRGKEKDQEGELLATPDHPILLSNDAYKPLKALQPGESLKAFKASRSVPAYRQIGLGVGETLAEPLRGGLVESGGRINHAYDLLQVDWPRLDRELKMYSIAREEMQQDYADNHQVISVEPTGIVLPVYDMTVKRTCNFVANGIVVHNSGATPSEAVSWGKIDPDRLPDAVVCYIDTTVALPLITAYAFAKRAPRPLKRLYDRREEMMNLLRREYERAMRK